MMMLLVFLALLLAGVPLAFSLMASGLLFFVMHDSLPVLVAVQRMVSSSQSFPLLAVPFFILAGHIMNASGITSRLISFANLLVCWISGGLAHVTIVLSALMGGVSGSAIADTAMQARILGKPMEDSGLPRGFSAAIISVSALITACIPPSIGLILYGYIGNVSIGKLFIAGLLPGALLTIALMLCVRWVASSQKLGNTETQKPPAFREVMHAASRCKWALLFPVLLIVTIRWGIFTPSEAGALAVVYAVLVGLFAYRELTFAQLYSALNESVRDIGMIMLIVLAAGTVGYVIAFQQLPVELAQSVGIDPVLFGILLVLVVTFGGTTPPETRITLVESEDFGVIGVGEATIPTLMEFNDFLGIKEHDLLRECQGTYKLGIDFVDWYQKGESYFHPFGFYGRDTPEFSFHQLWLRLNAMAEKGEIPADDSGWRWRIPLQTRIGNGHVYSSDFMEQDEALQKLLAGVEGEPVTQPLPLKFRTGHRKAFWEKNCVAIGLAGGFIEPLESTSIHLTQMGIQRLVNLWPGRGCNRSEIAQYNALMTADYERLRDFIVLHYNATEREDTEFWRYIKHMEIPDTLAAKLEIFRSSGRVIPSPEDLFTPHSWLAVMLGQGIYPQNYDVLVDRVPAQALLKNMQMLRMSVAKTAESMPTHEEFIRRYCQAEAA